MDEKLFIAFAKFEEGQREVHVEYVLRILHTQPCNSLSYLACFLIVLAEDLCT
jgi:hypothetical protein